MEDDLRLAFSYFETRTAGWGQRFIDRFFSVVEVIEKNAEIFPIKFDDFHRALIPKSDYALYYFAEGRTVIIAVVHSCREPRLTRDMIRTRRD